MLTLDSAAGRWLLLAAVLGSGVAGIDATVVDVAPPATGTAPGRTWAGWLRRWSG